MKHHSLLALLLCLFSVVIQAESTEITVRVLAKDAKFIGSSMDGAKVTITQKDTGKILASGLTEGETGNTKIIMKTAHARGDVLSSEGSAAFNASVDIQQPTKVTISATGPMNLGDKASTVSADYWLIPGKHLNQNDAVLLEMPGFYIVSQLQETESNKSTVSVTTNVRMMCGCPIEPEGLWNANDYEITAYLLKNGKEIARKSMKFEKTSVFSAVFEISDKGDYEIVTYAYDPATSNTGVDTVSFTK